MPFTIESDDDGVPVGDHFMDVLPPTYPLPSDVPPRSTLYQHTYPLISSGSSSVAPFDIPPDSPIYLMGPPPYPGMDSAPHQAERQPQAGSQYGFETATEFDSEMDAHFAWPMEASAPVAEAASSPQASKSRKKSGRRVSRCARCIQRHKKCSHGQATAAAASEPAEDQKANFQASIDDETKNQDSGPSGNLEIPTASSGTTATKPMPPKRAGKAALSKAANNEETESSSSVSTAAKRYAAPGRIIVKAGPDPDRM